MDISYTEALKWFVVMAICVIVFDFLMILIYVLMGN